MSKDAVRQLAELLDVERAALMAGELDVVAALAVEKEALAQKLEDAPASGLAALAAPLERNSALLRAAQDGVADVVAMLRRQRDARTRLSTYDSAGRATQISSRPNATERRY